MDPTGRALSATWLGFITLGRQGAWHARQTAFLGATREVACPPVHMSYS